VLRSTATRQAGFGSEGAERLPSGMRPPVLWRDGPEHREDRRQTARFFTPRRVATAYRDMMHRYADEQCERLRRRGRADLSQLALGLAVAVAGDVIGLTHGGSGMARRLERFFRQPAGEPRRGSPRWLYHEAYSKAALASFYVRDVRPAIRSRRVHRRDDLISHLIDQGCRDGEIFGECMTFAAAGMETTRHFIPVAAWHLFADDALRHRYLSGDEDARHRLLAELLRLEPVVGHILRTTTEPIEVPAANGTVKIPAGTRVDVAVARANLDPAAVGEAPYQVCPDRPLAGSLADGVLAFGDGPHRCPGAHIAITESDIFLTKLFALPGLRMHGPPRCRVRAHTMSYEVTGLIVTVD
jgi:cytochrome P450